MPVYQLLVYPVTNYAFDTSEQVNQTRIPLGTNDLSWFYGNYVNAPSDGANPEFSVLRANLKRLPPATVFTDDNDPLRSEGALYAQALMDAGVKADFRNFPGVTHEFFGMGAVLNEAQQANAQAAADLKR